LPKPVKSRVDRWVVSGRKISKKSWPTYHLSGHKPQIYRYIFQNRLAWHRQFCVPLFEIRESTDRHRLLLRININVVSLLPHTLLIRPNMHHTADTNNYRTPKTVPAARSLPPEHCPQLWQFLPSHDLLPSKSLPPRKRQVQQSPLDRTWTVVGRR
jgi:hypothetical protein